MPPKPWKTLSSRLIYENNWMRLREDVAELPNGNTTVYGVCEFGECVGVLPFVGDDRVLLVRQYRYVQEENHRWEMPTGGIRDGETAEEAAQRELQEEAGFKADRLIWLNSYYTSKCICQETAHLYSGQNLQRSVLPPDDTEFLEKRVFSFDKVLDMVLRGEIRDSMTVIAVLCAARLREE